MNMQQYPFFLIHGPFLTSLQDLDYLHAEKALLKIDDYKTIKYLKKVQQLDDR